MSPKLYLLCCLLAVVEWGDEAEIITVDLSQEEFDGWIVFIPVNRSKLQSRIDEINSEKSDVKFFLPSYHSCKDLVCEDQHVVVIAYGTVSAVLRDESSSDPDCDVALDSEAFAFIFPFLSSEPDQPDYTQELSLSQTPPDFSVCENLHECICDVDFCSVWDRYRVELTEAGSNVCQYWTHASDAVSCEASFEILEISTELKEYIALDGDHTTIVAGEMQKGSFGIGLKFPCVNEGIC
ncbi:hypothetical protein BSL78_13923 [Apostichopus japonicus]|uniref:Uncharacterized protein n=1 Tax=Stichopus japonicus TaxID=307972 RepID=A0A2G8KMF7_STIJA|nr:hypothetical protein BSL78_13923 [Apostichopus japonicus]